MTVLEINCRYKLTRCKTGVWAHIHKYVSHFSSSVIPSSVPVVHLSSRPYSRVIFLKSTEKKKNSWALFYFALVFRKENLWVVLSEVFFISIKNFDVNWPVANNISLYEFILTYLDLSDSFCKWSSFNRHKTCKGSINFHNSHHFLSFLPPSCGENTSKDKG